MPTIVGSVYVRVKAITDQLGDDISDGLTKSGALDSAGDQVSKNLTSKIKGGLGDAGIGDAAKAIGGDIKDNVDAAIKDIGKDAEPALTSRFKTMFGNVADGAKKAMSKIGDTNVFGTFLHTGRNTTEEMNAMWDKASQKAKKGIVRHFGDAFDKVNKAVKAIPTTLVLAANAVPALGGALQLVGSYAVALVGQIGFLATAIGGAAVAAMGLGVAAAFGGGVLMLAFKAETAQLDEFKKHLTETGDIWKNVVGGAAQAGMLPGLTQAVDQLALLAPEFVEFSEGFGEMIGQYAKMNVEILTSERSQEHLSGIMRGSINIWDNLLEAATRVFYVILPLFDAAMPQAVKFSESLVKVAEKFQVIIDYGSQTGLLGWQFQIWYDRAVLVFQALGDVWVGLWNILKIGADVAETTGTGFQTMTTRAQQFRDWTERSGESIKGMFDKAYEVFRKVNEIIGDIIATLAAPALQGDNAGVMKFLEKVEEWVPKIEKIFRTLGETGGDQIIGMVDKLLELADKLAESGALGSTLETIATALDLLVKAIDLPLIGGVVKQFVIWAGVWKGLSLIPGAIGGIKFAIETTLAVGMGTFSALLGTGVKDMEKYVSKMGGFQRRLSEIAQSMTTTFVASGAGEGAAAGAAGAAAGVKKKGGEKIASVTDDAAMVAIGRSTSGALGKSAEEGIEKAKPSLFKNMKSLGKGMVKSLLVPFTFIGGLLLDFIWVPLEAILGGIALSIGVPLGGLIAIILGVVAALGLIIFAFTDWEKFKSIVDTVWDAITGFFASIGGFLANIGGWIATGATWLWDWITESIPAAVDALKEWGASILAGILDWVSKLPERMIAAQDGVVAWIKEAGPKALEALGGFALTVWNWVAEFVPKIPGYFATAASALWTWIQDSWPQIKTALLVIGGIILSFLFGLPALIGIAVVTLGPSLWNWITESLPGVLLAIGEWIVSFLKALTYLPAKLIAFFITEVVPWLWNWIIESGPGVLKAIGEWILGVLKGLLGLVGKLIAFFVTDVIPALWGWIKDAIPIVLKWLFHFVSKILVGLLFLIPALIAITVKLSIALWNWIQDAIPVALAWLASFALGVLQWVLGFLAQIPTWFITAVWAFTQWIVDMIPVAALWLGNFGLTVLNWILDFIGKIPGWFLAAKDAFVLWIIENIPVIKAKLEEWRNAIWAKIKEFIDSLPEKFATAKDKIMEWIGKARDEAPGKLAEFGTKIVGWITDFITGLPNRIVGAADALLDVGTDIVSGLWQGIKDKGSWFIDQITGWVTDHIPGWMADVLGINSPAKVMIPIGAGVVEGMAVGIVQSTSLITDASTAAAEAAVAPFTDLSVPPMSFNNALNGLNQLTAATNGVGVVGGLGGITSTGPLISVTVKIGDRDITDIVDVQLDGRMGQLATAIRRAS